MHDCTQFVISMLAIGFLIRTYQGNTLRIHMCVGVKLAQCIVWLKSNSEMPAYTKQDCFIISAKLRVLHAGEKASPQDKGGLYRKEQVGWTCHVFGHLQAGVCVLVCNFCLTYIPLEVHAAGVTLFITHFAAGIWNGLQPKIWGIAFSHRRKCNAFHIPHWMIILYYFYGETIGVSSHTFEFSLLLFLFYDVLEEWKMTILTFLNLSYSHVPSNFLFAII